MGNHDQAEALKSLLDDSEWQSKEIKFEKLIGNMNEMFHNLNYVED